jgi:hypothetical protein
LIIVDVYKQRYISQRRGDTITFALTNATAFALHGATKANRKGMQVTVTPPATEGPPRVRMLNDSIPEELFVLEVVHYFESGLNHDSQYQVEILNPFMDNTIDLRYLQIFNAVPQ